MKLFFEAAAQAQMFLIMLPVGMLLAVFADLSALGGRFRPVWDVLTVLLAASAYGAGVILLREDGARLYHFLALLVGAMLYLLGIRKAILCTVAVFLRKRRENRQESATVKSNKKADTYGKDDRL
ncbi:MAG: hypothetical protein E7320_09540 [Clostridiales bacterium]|nr:hypothetical protein [Clostridiales bacterium]